MELTFNLLRKEREEVNSNLRQFAASNPDHTTLLDLSALIPRESLDDQIRKELWDDGLHFTSAGYDLFGEHVYQTLAPLLPTEK